MVFGGSQAFAEDGGATPAEIEEIIVKASWRGTRLEKADASIFVVDRATLARQPVKHFEQLTLLIPNLNWAGGSSRPRYFQLRGIGE